MKYTIEFELPDNETVKKQIKYCPVHWQIWGYCGDTIAKPKADSEADTPQTDCETCKYGKDKHRYAHICNECGVGINNYTPQTDCDKCIWSVCNYNKVDWDADTPQTEEERIREQCRALIDIVEQTREEVDE